MEQLHERVIVKTCIFDAPAMLPVILESLKPHGVVATVVVEDAEAPEDLTWQDLGFQEPPRPHALARGLGNYGAGHTMLVLDACAAAGAAFDAHDAKRLRLVDTDKKMAYAPRDEARVIRHDPVADVYAFGTPAQHAGSLGLQTILRVRHRARAVLDLVAGPHVPWLAHLCHNAHVYCVGAEKEIAPLRNASTRARLTFVKGHAYYPACVNALVPRAPFDFIRDHDPERTLAQACFAVENYPKLLVPSRGTFVAENVPEHWIPDLLLALHPHVRKHARVRGGDLVLDLSLARDAWIPYTPMKTFYAWLAAAAQPSVVVVLGTDETCVYSTALAAPEARVVVVGMKKADPRAPSNVVCVPEHAAHVAENFALPIDLLYVLGPHDDYGAWAAKVQLDGVVLWNWKTLAIKVDGAPVAHAQSGIAITTSNTALFRDVFQNWPDVVLGTPPQL